MRELRPGLWHWTSPHPGWTPAEAGPTGGSATCPPTPTRRGARPEGVAPAEFAAPLRPLLELPVELILLTHGDPVVEEAHAALAGALDRD